MKKIILLLTIIASGSVFGQLHTNFSLYFGVCYLPGGGYCSETHIKINNKVTHEFIYKWNKKRSKKLSRNKNIDKAVLELDSLLKLDKFKIVLNQVIIDSMKTNYNWKAIARIKSRTIDSLFKKGDTLTLILKDANDLNSNDVIDGRSFGFEFEYLKTNNDTINYKYISNIDAGVTYADLKYWIPIYLTNKKYHLFNKIPDFDYYFSDEIMATVVGMFFTKSYDEY